MAKVTKSVEVSKELSELGDGLAGMVGAVRAALADGWDTSSDVPVIVTAALAHLAPAVSGLDKLDDEWKEDRGAFMAAAGLALAKVVDAAVPAAPADPVA